MSRETHRLSGGILARERAAWEAGCTLPRCTEPTAGIIETVTGPRGVCAQHAEQGAALGYSVRREPLS